MMTGWRRACRESGLARIRARHTCAHRVDELLAILAALGGSGSATLAAEQAA